MLAPSVHTGMLDAGQRRLSWIAAGACLGLLAVALCLMFPHEATGAVAVWIDSTAYNHCFLIVPVSAYLAWRRRALFDRLLPQPDFRPLLLLVPLSLLWFAAAMLSVLELQQLIVLAMFQVLAMAVLGLAVYRAFLTPLLYLFFLVPAGYFLVPTLQRFTAWFALLGLHLVGIPVYSDGTLIEVSAGDFVTAEACAGIRFLIASVAFGVFFAAITFRSRVRWTLFVLLSIAIPIVANGLRAFGLIAAAEWLGSATAVMADHIIYGWVFFTFVTLIIIQVGFWMADSGAESVAPAGLGPEAPARPAILAIVSLVGFALAASGPAYATVHDWRARTAELAAEAPPAAGPQWSAAADDTPSWRPIVIAPDREFIDRFTDGSASVIRYVALYAAAGVHNNLVRGKNELADWNRWTLAGSGSRTVSLGGRDVAVATTEITMGGYRLLIWHFYIVGGRILPSPFAAKLAQLRGFFGGAEGVSAWVAVATEELGSPADAEQALARFLNQAAPLPTYLAALAPR